jgi:hypothetical protein
MITDTLSRRSSVDYRCLAGHLTFPRSKSPQTPHFLSLNPPQTLTHCLLITASYSLPIHCLLFTASPHTHPLFPFCFPTHRHTGRALSLFHTHNTHTHTHTHRNHAISYVWEAPPHHEGPKLGKAPVSPPPLVILVR